MQITIGLTDLLVLTSIVCLIFFTIYVVLTLKSLIKLLDESTKLVDESTKVVEDVQHKSEQVEAFVTDIVSNGKGIFKVFSVMNSLKK